jgi:transposase
MVLMQKQRPEPVWRPARLTPAQLEARRLEAFRLLERTTLSPAAVARRVGVSRQSVSRWQQMVRRGGRAALGRRPHTGRPPQVDRRIWRQLERVLRRGAVAAGFETERWTLRRISAVAQRTCGVRHHCRSWGRILRAHGWTPQRPATQAAERNEALIAAWLRRDWPRIKKGLVEAGGSLPSWTKQVSRFGPTSSPRGRPAATRPSSGVSPSGARSRVSSP